MVKELQEQHILVHLILNDVFRQVSEMQAEYFPPKVDIIIENEIPTDLYIIVSGAVVWLLQRLHSIKHLKSFPSSDSSLLESCRMS